MYNLHSIKFTSLISFTLYRYTFNLSWLLDFFSWEVRGREHWIYTHFLSLIFLCLTVLLVKVCVWLRGSLCVRENFDFTISFLRVPTYFGFVLQVHGPISLYAGWLNECSNQVTIYLPVSALWSHQYCLATDIFMQLPVVGTEMETPQLGPCMDVSGFNGLFSNLWFLHKEPPFQDNYRVLY